MKIWIDIFHIPQFNFYFPLMKLLAKQQHTIYLTILDRGKLVQISNKELQKNGLFATSIGEKGKVTTFIIGAHKLTKSSAILHANILRIPKILWWHFSHKVDIAFSNGFHAALACWMTRTRNYCFGDDPQTTDYLPRRFFSTKSQYTLYDSSFTTNLGKDISILRCLKEWAYLNPRIFQPQVEELSKYGIQPKEYIFLREVSVGTINYANQAAGAIRDVQHLISQLKTADSKPMKVLFSLEEKHRRHEYPADWILLQEPIEDIHSLIYYAAGLVSSGDSMAREAALLGIPAYYLGVRHSMPANLAASKVANLQNEKTMPFSDWLKGLQANRVQLAHQQEQMRKKIDEEFIDINEYMLSLVEQVEKSKN